MTEDYDVFAVETVEDDVFQTGEIVESLAYDDGDGVKEIYLDEVDEQEAELDYSVREFGCTESELDSVKVGVSGATEVESIVEQVFEDDSGIDDLMVEGVENLGGTETAETYRW